MRPTILALILLAPPAFGQGTPATPPASPDAKASITLLNGNPVPKTWPLGTSLTLSARSSVVGGLPKSYRWEIAPAWIDQHSTRSADGAEIVVATGRNPKSIAIAVDVAKGDTVDRTTLSIDFVIDPDEPGDMPPSPPPIDPTGALSAKMDDLGGKVDAGFAVVVAKLDPPPLPNPPPAPPSPPPAVVPTFSGPLNAVLIYDLDGTAIPTTPVRISTIEADLKPLAADWFALDSKSAAAMPFVARMAADKIAVPSVYVTDKTGHVWATVKTPKSKDDVIDAVKLIRGAK